jgi:hypothetical protein
MPAVVIHLHASDGESSSRRLCQIEGTYDVWQDFLPMILVVFRSESTAVYCNAETSAFQVVLPTIDLMNFNILSHTRTASFPALDIGIPTKKSRHSIVRGSFGCSDGII